jgi:DNA-binding MarR family transcriptional regulator
MKGQSREQDSKSRLIDINRLVHEPARLLILAHLYVVDSADFTYLMNQTNLTWGNLSSHMSKLEEAGYIQVKKTFINRKPNTMLKLTEDGRVAFQQYRQQIQGFMESLPD